MSAKLQTGYSFSFSDLKVLLTKTEELCLASPHRNQSYPLINNQNNVQFTISMVGARGYHFILLLYCMMLGLRRILLLHELWQVDIFVFTYYCNQLWLLWFLISSQCVYCKLKRTDSKVSQLSQLACFSCVEFRLPFLRNVHSRQKILGV